MKSYLVLILACFILNVCLVPAQTVLFEDNFNGASGAPPDAANWTFAGGTSVALDGNGHLSITSSGNGWSGPIMNSTFAFTTNGSADFQVDWHFTSIVGGASITWIGVRAQDGTDRSVDRGFFLHPSDRFRLYSSNLGTGIDPDGASAGQGLWADPSPGAASYATDAPVVLRQVLRANGSLEWWVNNGTAFEQLTPSLETVQGYGRTQDHVDFLSNYDVAGSHQYGLGFNASACCGSAGPFVIDRVVVTRLGAAATPTTTGKPNGIGQSWYLYN